MKNIIKWFWKVVFPFNINEKYIIKRVNIPAGSKIEMFDDLQLFNEMHNLLISRKGNPIDGYTVWSEKTHQPIYCTDVFDNITITYKRKEIQL